MTRDLYDVLGVGRDADAEAIKRAYRARAWEVHPDVAADADDACRFHEVSEAYRVLSDERARRVYDRLGWRGRGQEWTPRRDAARVYASNPRAFITDVETILSAAVGRRPRDTADRVVAEIEVDPYEAFVGTTRTVSVEEEQACPACDGQRRRTTVSESKTGRFVALYDCAACGGTGAVRTTVDLELVVPARARASDTISLGATGVAVVRIVAPRDALAIRLGASAALLAALGFLLYLLAL